MGRKLYFNEDCSEHCYTLDYFYEEMAYREEKTMKVFEAKMMIGQPYFYCTIMGEVGEVGDGCGKECSKYKPRNGENGRCKYSNNTYELTDKFKILINQTTDK